MNGIMEVKCFDTITREYVTVEVSEDIGTFYKRSYWREDMQQRRFNERVLHVDALDKGVEDCILKSEFDVEQKIIEQQSREVLQRVVSTLSEDQRRILRLIHYNDSTLSAIASDMGVSPSYMSKHVKGIYKRLQEQLRESL